MSAGGKSGRCVGLKTCHLLVPTVIFWESQPPGALRACLGLLWDNCTFTG